MLGRNGMVGQLLIQYCVSIKCRKVYFWDNKSGIVVNG